jgi:hypothetical protein
MTGQRRAVGNDGNTGPETMNIEASIAGRIRAPISAGIPFGISQNNVTRKLGTHLRKRPNQVADVGEFPDNHERSRHGSHKRSGSALKHERAGGDSGSTGSPWRISNCGGRDDYTNPHTSVRLRYSSCQTPFIRG